MFYLECGDSVCNIDETTENCADDCVTASCGDGVCNFRHENVSTCLADCYGITSETSSSLCGYVMPQSNVQAGIPLNDDSLGLLIGNFYWCMLHRGGGLLNWVLL